MSDDLQRVIDEHSEKRKAEDSPKRWITSRTPERDAAHQQWRREEAARREKERDS